MNTFKRFFYLHAQAAAIELYADDKVFMGKYAVDLSAIDDLQQLVDLSIGHGRNIVRFLCGSTFGLKSVYFTHAAPADIKPYREIFKAPINFNAEFNALAYDAAILKIPIRQHDEELHRLLTRRLLELEQSHPEDFVSQVEHVIRQMLPTGKCSVELTAKCLNPGKRALQSRLKDERVTFQQLLDRIRSDIASSYLKESVVTMTTLAELLGYSELSAFSRAFKRWFGVAPLSWKVGTPVILPSKMRINS